MGAVAQTAVVAGVESQNTPAAALCSLLDDLVRLLMTLPAEIYRARVARVSGSIGGHVRHTLDHVAAVVSARGDAALSYDHRSRGTAVEHDPEAAIHEILRLEVALQRWPARTLQQPIAVTSQLTTSGEGVTGWSTLARELAFVVSHTVHHQAMIALLLEMQGLAVENERFGYAPSTPKET
jgi:uncharacterized damage-inducible protein DinB